MTGLIQIQEEIVFFIKTRFHLELNCDDQTGCSGLHPSTISVLICKKPGCDLNGLNMAYVKTPLNILTILKMFSVPCSWIAACGEICLFATVYCYTAI